MRVLVTGANGFIGSRLVEKLKSEGYDVQGHTLEDGDISIPGSLDKWNNVQHVFHLAARTFVPESWEEAHNYFQTNIMGTVTVLEFCRKNNCSLTFMSTYVYGQPQYLPIDENHPIQGISPYHESKIVCEDLCAFYSHQFGVKITILRPFNVYGKGQNDSFLVSKIYSQVMDKDNKTIAVMDLEPKRDYVYVDDVVTALIMTHNATKNFAIYNVGSGLSVSVEDVVRAVLIATGITKPYKSTQQSRLTEVSDCIADISSLRRDCGFEPKFSLLEGLRAWHQEENFQKKTVRFVELT